MESRYDVKLLAFTSVFSTSLGGLPFLSLDVNDELSLRRAHSIHSLIAQIMIGRGLYLGIKDCPSRGPLLLMFSWGGGGTNPGEELVLTFDLVVRIGF